MNLIFDMFGFGSIMMRDHCSCGEKGKKFDKHFFECPLGCGVWDGADEWREDKVLAMNKHTVVKEI